MARGNQRENDRKKAQKKEGQKVSTLPILFPAKIFLSIKLNDFCVEVHHS